MTRVRALRGHALARCDGLAPGVCECGTRSEGDLDAVGRARWHRRHKTEVRAMLAGTRAETPPGQSRGRGE